MVTIQAPAKINLTLEVLGKRSDGFHELRSVIQTISLQDTYNLEEADKTTFSSDSPEWNGHKSLTDKAIRLVQEKTGYRKGVKVHCEKRIPLMGGLGGDSSGAAAILKGLNHLWNLNLSLPDMHRMAEQLGSDVPFFLYGGTALMEGRGEKITPLPPFPCLPVLLVFPAVERKEGKTGLLYGKLTAKHYSGGQASLSLASILREKKPFTQNSLYNTFDSVIDIVFPRLNQVRELMLATGCEHFHTAGSGPVLFSIEPDGNHAAFFLQQLLAEGLDCCLCQTIQAKDPTDQRSD